MEARPIPPTALVHQEGVVAALALLGLLLRDGSLAGLRPVEAWPVAVAAGAALGVGLAAVGWALRRLPAVAAVERWQGRLVGRWSRTDAAAVAIFSGAAEEALARALLVPLVGVWAAAAVFAVLHVVPDRRLWAWPLLAFGAGLALGWAFTRWGYPAAAAAHAAANAVALLRLAGRGVE